MAEVVGLIASIGTLASGGLQIAKAISTFADELGAAGDRARFIAKDVKHVSVFLNDLKKRLARLARVTAEIEDTVLDLVDLCKDELHSIKNCLLPILPRDGGVDTGKLNLRQKLRWVFCKAKIATRQASLNSLKLTLSLFLHTLDFVEDETFGEYTKEQVEEEVARFTDTKASFLEAERQDQACKSAFKAFEAHNWKGPNEGDQACIVFEGKTSITHDSDNQSETTSIAESAPVVEHDELDDLELTTKLVKQQQQLQRGKASDLVLAESLSNDDFIMIARHLRVQKVVANLAQAVVSQHEFRETDYTSNSAPSVSQQPNSWSPRRQAPKAPRVSRDGVRHYEASQAGQDEDEDEGQDQTYPDGLSQANYESDSKASETYTGSTGATFRRPPSGENNPDDRSTWDTFQRRASARSVPRPEAPRPKHQGVPHSNYPGYFAGSTDSPSGTHRSRPPYGQDFEEYETNQESPGFQSYSQWIPRSARFSGAPELPPDPEKEAMKQELELIRAKREKREAEAKQKELEDRIRQEAEDSFQRKMDQVRRDEEVRAEERRLALERAKREIEEARKDAERAAREAIENERKAEVERAKREAEFIARAERIAREKLETEQRAEERRIAQRGGLKKFFSGSHRL